MTPNAKRALNFGGGTPNKRARMTNAVIIRGPRSEMKTNTKGITHTAATASNLTLAIDQGVGNEDRVGSKIKVWRMTGQIYSVVPCRVDLLLPNSSDDQSPAYSYYADPDRRTYNVLHTWSFRPQQATNSEFFQINYKFPVGLIQRYDGATDADVNSHALVLRVTCPTSETILGSARLWFTDQ